MVKIRHWSSKPHLLCKQGKLIFSLNQQILKNLNGNLNNDESSQIKTRVHVLQQIAEKKGRSSILRAALLYTGNLPA